MSDSIATTATPSMWQPLRWYRDNLPKLLAEDERESGLPRWAQDRFAVMRGALRAEAEPRRAQAAEPDSVATADGYLRAADVPITNAEVRAWLDGLGVPVPVGIQTLMTAVRRMVITAGDAGRTEAVADLAATGDVAADLGVKNAAVSNYPRRYADFPAPLTVLSTGPVYSREQVREWARARWPTWEFPWTS